MAYCSPVGAAPVLVVLFAVPGAASVPVEVNCTFSSLVTAVSLVISRCGASPCRCRRRPNSRTGTPNRRWCSCTPDLATAACYVLEAATSCSKDGQGAKAVASAAANCLGTASKLPLVHSHTSNEKTNHGNKYIESPVPVLASTKTLSAALGFRKVWPGRRRKFAGAPLSAFGKLSL